MMMLGIATALGVFGIAYVAGLSLWVATEEHLKRLDKASRGELHD